MSFAGGVLLLGAFLPSSEGSEPFHFAAPCPHGALEGRRERKGEKGPPAVNKLSTALVPRPLGGTATRQGLGCRSAVSPGRGN